MELEQKIVYFEKAGKHNTDQTLKLARERAEFLGITKVVLVSSNGFTASLALKIFQNTNIQLIVIGTSREAFHQDVYSLLKQKKIPVRFSSEVEYAFPEIVQNAYRKMSEGMKVVIDLGMIVSVEGLAANNEEIVAVGGTGSRGFTAGGGADTAVVLVPLNNEVFSKLPENKDDRRAIKEFICKPR
jgi:hypothetical protein